MAPAKWGKIVSWWVPALLSLPILGCAGVLIHLALARNFGWYGIAFVALCVAIWVIVSYRVLFPASAPDPAAAKRAQRMWIFAGLLLSALGGVIGIVASIQPAAPAEPTARILEKMPGRWGEEGCRVTLRFTIQGRALRIEFDRPPPGSAPPPIVATISHAEGDVLETRATYPDGARAATFTYQTDGVSEWLTWRDYASHGSAPFRRCP